MKDRSCITRNVIVRVPKIGMGIVHIQHVKLLNPNVFHEKTTKQFINKNQKNSKRKKKKEKRKNNDENFQNTYEICITEHEEPQIVKHKQKKLSMKNETDVTNLKKEMTYLLKLKKLNIQPS
jgi:hypothetical protein